jgi:hypothetical protein
VTSDVTPDVTVIVPTRNRAALLRRLLDQLVRLDGDLVTEIIVVDEGSSDDTPALLDRYGREHGVRVVRHDVPRGLPAARNAGLRAASGRYVAWIDDDDLTSTDRLCRQHQALVASGARWSCSARVDIDDDLQVIGHFPCPPSDGLLRALLRINVLPTAAQGLLVERALADEAGPYDETLRSAEDWEYCIRLAALAAPHLLDEPLVAYRTGVASMSTDTPRMEEAIRAVVARHAGLYERYDVSPNWAAIHDSLLSADLLGSRRRSIVRAARSWLAEPTRRRAARVVMVAVAPGWYARQSADRRRAQVPESWRGAARRWLDGVVSPANLEEPAKDAR